MRHFARAARSSGLRLTYASLRIASALSCSPKSSFVAFVTLRSTATLGSLASRSSVGDWTNDASLAVRSLVRLSRTDFARSGSIFAQPLASAGSGSLTASISQDRSLVAFVALRSTATLSRSPGFALGGAGEPLASLNARPYSLDALRLASASLRLVSRFLARKTAHSSRSALYDRLPRSARSQPRSVRRLVTLSRDFSPKSHRSFQRYFGTPPLVPHRTR